MSQEHYMEIQELMRKNKKLEAFTGRLKLSKPLAPTMAAWSGLKIAGRRSSDELLLLPLSTGLRSCFCLAAVAAAADRRRETEGAADEQETWWWWGGDRLPGREEEEAKDQKKKKKKRRRGKNSRLEGKKKRGHVPWPPKFSLWPPKFSWLQIFYLQKFFNYKLILTHQ